MKRARFRGFAPVVGRAPRVLILGTLPSVLSCATQQYYGNPRNHFWQIMESVTGVSHEAAYAARIKALRRQGIALWDVLAAGQRVGSGDATIARERPNDLDALLARHPTLVALFFNGGKAEALFRRHQRAGLRRVVQQTRLPSSSPANARLSVRQKTQQWQRALGFFIEAPR